MTINLWSAEGTEGLPMEIYCFSNDTEWAAYEGIQDDIFDHVFAIAPEFGLRLYKRPAGADLKEIGVEPRFSETAV